MPIDLDYRGDSATPQDKAAQRTRRERTAWGAMVAILALLALQTGGGTTPRDEDLAFVRTLLDIKGHLRAEYVRDLDDAMLDRAAIDGMLRLTTDPHTNYIPPAGTKQFEDSIAGRFDGIGILVEAANLDDPNFSRQNSPSGGLIVVSPIPNSPAMLAGLRSGDHIVAVDGVDVREMTETEITDRITGPTGTSVALAIERPVPETGKLNSFEVSVVRAAVQSPVLEGAARRPDGSPVFLLTPPQLPDGLPADALPRIAYIRLTQFTENCSAAILATLEQLTDEGGPLDGFILDLRGNPGGLLNEATELLDLFIGQGVLVWSEGEHAPRQIIEANPEVAERAIGMLPMVVLVDRFSASASEVAAGALADHHRATVVGERSYGKGSVQAIIQLDNKGRLKVTTAYYRLPGGRIVDRQPDSPIWGIDPHVPALIDLNDPNFRGERNGLILPGPVWRAYEVLLAQLAATSPSGIWTPVPPATTRPTNRSASTPQRNR